MVLRHPPPASMECKQILEGRRGSLAVSGVFIFINAVFRVRESYFEHNKLDVAVQKLIYPPDILRIFHNQKMLPTFVTNLFWGASDAESQQSDGVVLEADEKQAMVEHSVQEECEGWLLIDTVQQSTDSCSDTCPNDDGNSVFSDGSWVITPGPTFRHSTGEIHDDTFHPLEDLLIEHPTMSVYCRRNSNTLDNISDEEGTNMNLQEPHRNRDNQNHELVLVRNRQRHQLAVEMQIPPSLLPLKAPPTHGTKPPRLTRRALKRHNTNRKHQGNRIPKCSFKAGRRRC